MAVLETYLHRADLKKWDKPVADLMMHLVNDLGVRYRMQDANHIFLYGPNGETRPFKASASRPGPQQLKFLTEFAEEQCAEAEKAWRAREEERRSAAPVPVAPAVRRPAPKSEVVTNGGPELRELTRGRQCYIKKGQGGGVIKYLETDGLTLWCRVVGCEWTGTTVVGGSAHYRMVHEGSLAKVIRTSKSDEVRAQRQAERRAERHAAIEVLAKAVGYEFGPSISKKDAKQIERLEKQLAKVTAERDEAVAKVKALKEALK